MKTVRDYLDVELQDDHKVEYGGTSYAHETLRNFCDECDIPYNTPIEVVNAYLISCGIIPVC